MADFFIEGGFGMYPVLVLGLLLVGSAGRFALDGEPVRMRFFGAVSLALAAATGVAMLTDVARVMWYLSSNRLLPEAFMQVLAEGLKESSRPGILGGILLMIGLILVAVGTYRVGRRELRATRGISP